LIKLPHVGLIPLLSFLFAAGLTPLVIKLAQRFGRVAAPQADRWHKKPTALLGGIAIYLAFALAIIPFLGGDPVLWAVFGGATFMFLSGLYDDLFVMQPASKLLVQVIATVVLILSGLQFLGHWPYWISLPLTFLWVIGITNAVNLLDNMDGLAAGVTGIATGALCLFAYLSGEILTVIPLLALVGACLGYLIYNFHPGKIFMGDSGSLFLGYILAAGGLLLQSKMGAASTLAVFLLPILVVVVPIFDTSLVTFSRLFASRPISQGGRDHSSHRLVFLGLSEKKAVLTLYGISILFGSLGLLLYRIDLQAYIALIVLMAIGLGVFGLYLGKLRVYRSDEEVAKSVLSVEKLAVLNMVVRQKKLILGMIADICIVGACFVIAHYLRYEDGLSEALLADVQYLLPLVIVIKLLFYFIFRLYWNIWQFAGTHELLRIVYANFIASVAVVAIIHIVLGYELYSYSVYIIDFILATGCVAVVRLIFRGFNQIFATFRKAGKKVIIYGAGVGGSMCLREIRQNEKLGFDPVGFIDDSEAKQRSIVQGLNVLGGFQELKTVIREGSVDEVLLATGRLPEERREAIINLCNKYDIGCRDFYIGFRKLNIPTETQVPWM